MLLIYIWSPVAYDYIRESFGGVPSHRGERVGDCGLQGGDQGTRGLQGGVQGSTHWGKDVHFEIYNLLSIIRFLNVNQC